MYAHRILLLSIFLIGPLQSHASCADLLLRVGRVLQAFRGKEVMQEDRPIAQQLLASDHANDKSLAFAWADRDAKNSTALGPGINYWGPSPDTVEFILTVPHWTEMKNHELRALVEINALLSWSIFEDANVLEHTIDNSDLARTDLLRWQRTFPSRPIPPVIFSKIKN